MYILIKYWFVKRVSFFDKSGFKKIIEYKDDEKFNPLCIMFSKMGEYEKKDFMTLKYLGFFH